MRVSGIKRKLLALAGLAVLAALMATTIDPGKVRLVGEVILGGFALRILLTHEPKQEAEEEDGQDGSDLQAELPTPAGTSR